MLKWRRLDRVGRFAIQQADSDVRSRARQIGHRCQRTANDSATELEVIQPKNRSTRRRPKLCERIGFAFQNPFGVLRQRRIEDRRVRRQGRRALEHFWKRQIVPPDEVQTSFEPFEFAYTLVAPEILEGRRADGNKNRGRVGTKDQDVVDDFRHAQIDGDTRGPYACGLILDPARIEAAWSTGVAGKSSSRILSGEGGCRPAHRDDEIQAPASNRGPQVVHDRFFVSAVANGAGWSDASKKLTGATNRRLNSVRNSSL